MVELILSALPLAIIASTPLLLAVLGELVVQRSGMINLGLEGMMLTAALCTVVAARMSGSAAVGFAGGVAGAGAVALLFGFLVIVVRTDQIVTGTAINLLSLGMTGFIYREVQRDPGFMLSLPRPSATLTPALSWIAIPLLLAFLLWMTTAGLRLRAAGENPEAVSAAGFAVSGYRWLALAIQAVLTGVAGAHLALALSSGFAENMTAGRGYIALSIVIFGRWKVKGALLGTALFGIATALQYAAQAADRGIPFHLLLLVPYLVTFLVLCGVAGKVRAPASLGK